MTRAGRTAMSLAGEFIRPSQLRPLWFRLGFHWTGSSWFVDADAEWNCSRKLCPNGSWTTEPFTWDTLLLPSVLMGELLGLASAEVCSPFKSFQHDIWAWKKKQLFDPEKFSRVGHYRLSWSLGEDPTCTINPAFQTGLISSLASYNQN